MQMDLRYCRTVRCVSGRFSIAFSAFSSVL